MTATATAGHDLVAPGEDPTPCPALIAGIGLAAGMGSGLFGIGGGLVMVLLGRVRQHQAHAASLGAASPNRVGRGDTLHRRAARGRVAGWLVPSTIAMRLDPIVLQPGFRSCSSSSPGGWCG